MNIFLPDYLHKMKIKIPLNLSLDDLHSILKNPKKENIHLSSEMHSIWAEPLLMIYS